MNTTTHVERGHCRTARGESSITAVDLLGKRTDEMRYRSLLSQQLRVEKSDHSSPSQFAVRIKKLVLKSAGNLVQELLDIAPDLDDSPQSKNSDQSHDLRGSLVGAWFRRIVLARSQIAMLTLASQSDSIIEYLRNALGVEDLLELVRAFEHIDGHLLRLLRLAMEDVFHSEGMCLLHYAYLLRYFCWVLRYGARIAFGQVARH